jgi:hypothetical protein
MTKPLPSDLPVLSSHVDHKLTHTVFMDTLPSQPYAPDPVNKEEWFDPLDPALIALVEENMTNNVISYQGEPITTLAHRVCGNTSGYWLILMGNGFMHPDEIPRGAFLRMPNFNAIRSKLNARKPRSSTVQTVLF